MSDDEILTAVHDALTGELKMAEHDDDRICDLCGEEIKQGERSKWGIYGYKVLDKHCFNATKACSRALCGKTDMRRSLEVMQENEPLKFKNLMISLRTQGKNQRKPGQAASAIECVEILVSEQTKSRNHKQLLFTKRQYMSWKKLNEEMASAEAKQAWEDDKTDDDVYQEKNKKGGTDNSM